MNITLSVDEQVVARVRKKAAAQGTSLNQMVREYLETLAKDEDVEEWIAEFESLSGKGNSNGWKFNRDELYDRTL